MDRNTNLNKQAVLLLGMTIMVLVKRFCRSIAIVKRKTHRMTIRVFDLVTQTDAFNGNQTTTNLSVATAIKVVTEKWAHP